MLLRAEGLVKKFDDRIIFRNLQFRVESGSALVITGANGAGKTTLLKILSHLMAPTRGEVIIENQGKKIDRERVYQHIGLVGPYLQLYGELTAAENLDFFMRMRGLKNIKQRVNDLMKILGLNGRENDAVRAFSSGMLQKLKYVCALMHEPDILFVDEPRSNLDEEGIEAVVKLMNEQKHGRILVIATNDQEDLALADQIIRLGVE